MRKPWSLKPCSRLVKPVVRRSIGPATKVSLSGADFDLPMLTCSHIKLHTIQYKKINKTVESLHPTPGHPLTPNNNEAITGVSKQRKSTSQYYNSWKLFLQILIFIAQISVDQNKNMDIQFLYFNQFTLMGVSIHIVLHILILKKKRSYLCSNLT